MVVFGRVGEVGAAESVGRMGSERFGPAVLAVVGGVLLAAFPLMRPWGDKAGGVEEMVSAFSSPVWVVAHVTAMAGFVVLAAAVIMWGAGRGWSGGWRRGRSRGRSVGPRRGDGAGSASWWFAGGVALMLPFFGAETFGLHAIASGVPQEMAIPAANAVREGVLQMAMFGAGLLSIAAGGILLARRDRSAVVLAIAVATYGPQFFVGPPIRIAHGVVLLAGAALWAWSMVRDVRAELVTRQ